MSYLLLIWIKFLYTNDEAAARQSSYYSDN